MKWTIYLKFKQHIPWQATRPSQVQDQMGPDWYERQILEAIFRGEMHLSWPSTSVKSFQSSPLTKTPTHQKNHRHHCPALHLWKLPHLKCVRSNLVRAENIFVTPNDSNADQQCDVLDCLSTTGWRYNWRQRYKFPTTTTVTWQNTTIVTHFAL